MVVFWIILIIEIISYTLAENGQCGSSPNIVPVCSNSTDSYKQMYIPVNGSMADGCQCDVTLVDAASAGDNRISVSSKLDQTECGYKVVIYNTINNNSWTCSNNEIVYYSLSLNESFQLTFTSNSTQQQNSTGFCLQLNTTIKNTDTNNKFTITCWRSHATQDSTSTTLTPQSETDEETTPTTTITTSQEGTTPQEETTPTTTTPTTTITTSQEEATPQEETTPTTTITTSQKETTPTTTITTSQEEITPTTTITTSQDETTPTTTITTSQEEITPTTTITTSQDETTPTTTITTSQEETTPTNTITTSPNVSVTTSTQKPAPTRSVTTPQTSGVTQSNATGKVTGIPDAAIIGGGAAGACLLLIIIIVIIVCLMKQRKNNKYHKPSTRTNGDTGYEDVHPEEPIMMENNGDSQGRPNSNNADEMIYLENDLYVSADSFPVNSTQTSRSPSSPDYTVIDDFPGRKPDKAQAIPPAEVPVDKNPNVNNVYAVVNKEPKTEKTDGETNYYKDENQPHTFSVGQTPASNNTYAVVNKPPKNEKTDNSVEEPNHQASVLNGENPREIFSVSETPNPNNAYAVVNKKSKVTDKPSKPKTPPKPGKPPKPEKAVKPRVPPKPTTKL